jgi:hypothetical protein
MLLSFERGACIPVDSTGSGTVLCSLIYMKRRNVFYFHCIELILNLCSCCIDSSLTMLIIIPCCSDRLSFLDRLEENAQCCISVCREVKLSDQQIPDINNFRTIKPPALITFGPTFSGQQSFGPTNSRTNFFSDF